MWPKLVTLVYPEHSMILTGTKKKKAVNKKEAAKVVKKTPKRRPNTGPSLVSSDGHAPLRKKVVSPE